MTDPYGQIGWNELCFLRKGDQDGRANFFILDDLVLPGKSFKRCTLNHFWQLLRFLRNFSIGQSSTSYDREFCPNCLKRTEPLLEGGGVTVLEESSFIWNYLVLAAKTSKECTPSLFREILSFLRNFSIGKTFTSNDRTFYPNWFKWTETLVKG